MKISFKKGAGEFMGFAICIPIVIGLFISTYGVVIFGLSMQTLDDVSSRAARAAVVGTSYDDAQKKAEKAASEYLSGSSNGSVSNVKVKVEPAEAKVQEWKRGNYIKVTVSEYIQTLTPFTSGTRQQTTIIMIERNST